MKTCPRCSGPLSRDRFAATSRTDNKTKICAACGTAEALERVRTGKVTAKRNWPVASLRDVAI